MNLTVPRGLFNVDMNTNILKFVFTKNCIVLFNLFMLDGHLWLQ